MNKKNFNPLDILDWWPLLVIILIIIMFVVNAYRMFSKAGPRRIYRGTVTEKTVKRKGKSEDLYLIFTKSEQGSIEVLEVSDSIVAGRFNSSDLYGSIEVGKTYDFQIAGTRNGVFSWYPNIYKADPVEFIIKGECNYDVKRIYEKESHGINT